MSKQKTDKFQHDPTELPMTLWVDGSPGPLLQQQILRKMPGKRWVISAYWNDKPVVAKLFRKYRRAQQELIRVKALHAADMKTPMLLHHRLGKATSSIRINF